MKIQLIHVISNIAQANNDDLEYALSNKMLVKQRKLHEYTITDSFRDIRFTRWNVWAEGYL